MTKSIIECPWDVGDKLYLAPNSFHRTRPTSDDAIKDYMWFHDCGPVFPIVQLRVVGMRVHHLRFDTHGVMCCTPVTSAIEDIYKVIRSNKTQAIAILTQDMSEVVRLEWPASKPFHDALGPVEENKFRQVMYVSALNVDGNYKLIEVLDDQDW